MAFAHDTEIALKCAVALLNTAPGYGDSGLEDLPTLASLTTYMDDWQFTGGRPRTRAELEQVHVLRPRLRQIWTASDVPAMATEVNDLLAECDAVPRVVEHDGLGWHIHATGDDAPIARRMAVEAAMALIDLIRAQETSRVRICAANDCDNALIDLSKNRSRRYCDGSCANNAHVAAYRSRQISGRKGRANK